MYDSLDRIFKAHEENEFIHDPSDERMKEIYENEIDNKDDYNSYQDFIDSVRERVDKRILWIVSQYDDENLKDAIRFMSEIPFNCKHYYLLPAKDELWLNQRLGG